MNIREDGVICLSQEEYEKLKQSGEFQFFKDEKEYNRYLTKMFYQAIRIAVAGSTVSEPVHELLSGVGKEESLRRIETVMKMFGARSSTGE